MTAFSKLSTTTKSSIVMQHKTTTKETIIFQAFTKIIVSIIAQINRLRWFGMLEILFAIFPIFCYVKGLFYIWKTDKFAWLFMCLLILWYHCDDKHITETNLITLSNNIYLIFYAKEIDIGT